MIMCFFVSLSTLKNRHAVFSFRNSLYITLKKQKDDDLDDVIFARMTNLLSHGNHSIFNPVEMVEDNKEIFISILNRFLENYKFNDDLFTEG